MDCDRCLLVRGIHFLPVTVDHNVGSTTYLLLWMTVVCTKLLVSDQSKLARFLAKTELLRARGFPDLKINRDYLQSPFGITDGIFCFGHKEQVSSATAHYAQ